ncbi:uncharacterized protein LOC114259874 [Camellia sinensis]|uniref:uncharacterized protein LOC114259874 n=1 Tax=Camellia sinensis TaxID=4442 RepID=UPI0010357567|nr:uncharacterized protein LOC114259874 [Camellia sinensis]
MKTEWGFAQLLPLSTFNDADNGYLICDTCVFGAEVCVINYTSRGQSINILKERNNTYTWKIDNFSSLDGEIHYSDNQEFTAISQRKFNCKGYPKGNLTAKDKCQSLILGLNDLKTFPSVRKTYAKFKMRMRNQYHGEHMEIEGYNCFTSSSMAWGPSSFLLLTDLHDASNDFLVNDTLIVEAKVSVLSTGQNFSVKLSPYPNGDEERNGEEYISLYLVIAETNNLPPGWEVNVSFKLFVYHEIQDKYMTIQGS